MDSPDCKTFLPANLRCHIYSFLTLTELITLISKLSQTERKLLTMADELTQPRSLRIKMNQDENCDSTEVINYEVMEYLIKLVNGNLLLKVCYCEASLSQFQVSTVVCLEFAKQ